MFTIANILNMEQENAMIFSGESDNWEVIVILETFKEHDGDKGQLQILRYKKVNSFPDKFLHKSNASYYIYFPDLEKVIEGSI